MSEPRGVIAVGGSARWDEGRNTSQVKPPAPDALPNALRAMAAWRETNPAHAAWIAEGAPRLTEADHLRRFGEPYDKKPLSHKPKRNSLEAVAVDGQAALVAGDERPTAG